jgi:2-keto-4-pentenoate hydratase/2-oxohepta-3-ene-1,7-dioic acid hydratase in catechol pathway
MAYLPCYIAEFTTLQTGDVISIGTLSRVGQKPLRYLRAAQAITLGITGLDIQRQRTISAENE